MRYEKKGTTVWTGDEKVKRAERRAVALQATHEQRNALRRQAPKIVELERTSRKNFELEMKARNRCEPDGVDWWRRHERAQAWHEIATMLCEAKNVEGHGRD
ncbi:hypothetical protein EP7_004301 [Isosphaeraceae bacterium EP7]